jgi:hypothetical protein
VAGAEDFFVLDVRARHRKHLRTETEFAEHTGHRVVGEFGVVFVDGGLFSLDEFGQDAGPSIGFRLCAADLLKHLLVERVGCAMAPNRRFSKVFSLETSEILLDSYCITVILVGFGHAVS